MVNFIFILRFFMKKIISIVSTLCLTLACLFISACTPTQHPIDAFKEKMKSAQNYQMDMTIKDMPFFGTLTITAKIDGNKSVTLGVLGSSDVYTETVDGITYEYAQDEEGNWTKEVKESGDTSESEMFDDEQMNALFTGANYTKVNDEENTYKLNEDVSIEDATDVTMTVSDTSCTIKMKMNSEGMLLDCEIKIHNIGNTSVNLPKATPSTTTPEISE